MPIIPLIGFDKIAGCGKRNCALTERGVIKCQVPTDLPWAGEFYVCHGADGGINVIVLY